MPSLINLEDVTVNQRLYDVLESLFHSWGGIGEQSNDPHAYTPKALKGYKMLPLTEN